MGSAAYKVRTIPQLKTSSDQHYVRPTQKHPDSGHVVVINIHKDRSDALALMSGVNEPIILLFMNFL